MSEAIVVSLVGLAGTLVLAFVAALSLATSRQLLVRVSRQLEIAESQAEMQMIRNAFVEMSEFLQIFVQKPHLRPFFYEDRALPTGDPNLDAEVTALTEWILTNFATAIGLAVMLPAYPIGALKETIKFHLRHSPPMRAHLEERFSAFPVTGLTLLRWMHDSKRETLQTLAKLEEQALARSDPAEVARIRDLSKILAAADEETDLRFSATGLAGSRAGAIT